MIEKILLKVEKERLKEQISGELFERDYNEIEEIIKKYLKDKLLKQLGG